MVKDSWIPTGKYKSEKHKKIKTDKNGSREDVGTSLAIRFWRCKRKGESGYGMHNQR